MLTGLVVDVNSGVGCLLHGQRGRALAIGQHLRQHCKCQRWHPVNQFQTGKGMVQSPFMPVSPVQNHSCWSAEEDG